MTKSQMFVVSHSKQIIALFVVVVAVVAWQAIDQETALKKARSGQVAGATDVAQTVTAGEKNKQLIISYQARLKNSLATYLRQRATAGEDAGALSVAIDQAKAEILALSVPGEYQELQLKVVTTLDREKEALANKKALGKQTSDNDWEEILRQYFWLNN